MLIDAALDGLAQASVFTGELGEALRSCRDAIESAARYRYFSSLAVALQYGAVALARAGDALVAAQLLDCVRAHGHRVHGNVEAAVTAAAADPPSIGGSRLSTASLLDAAEIALGVIDALLQAD